MIQAIVFDVDGVILHKWKIIQDSYNFIKQNHKKYTFFTNTTFSKSKLQKLFSDLDIWKYFMELLAYEDGNKRQNIEYIKEVYNLSWDTILFIDDLNDNLEQVKNTKVHTLLFTQDSVSLQEKINTKLNI